MAEITCPACARLLDAPEHCTGVLVQCSACRHTFTAREPARAASPPPPIPDDNADAPERFRRPLTPHRGAPLLTLSVTSLILLALALWHTLFALAALLLGTWSWLASANDLQAIHAGHMDSTGTRLLRAARRLALAAALLGLAWLIVGMRLR
jgi:hypothetical protein